MNAGLQAVKTALAGMTDAELRALIDATSGSSPMAPGLLTWVEVACGWELSRRLRLDYKLPSPDATIPPEEDAISIDAAIKIRATFALIDPAGTGAVLAFFDAMVDLLTGAERKHW